MYIQYILNYCMGRRCKGKESKRDEYLKNTFILALDGDVDFQPEAVHQVIDTLRSNHKAGACCGIIKPLGSGMIYWYQKFEYAVSHWLQKAAEHFLGSVLCSPGCFSLLRASALVDDDNAPAQTAPKKYASTYEPIIPPITLEKKISIIGTTPFLALSMYTSLCQSVLWFTTHSFGV